MSVDYRLLPRFEASRKRYEAARRVLPAHWRNDPRPEAQIINDHWVGVIAAAAAAQQDRAVRGRPAASTVFLVDDSS